jgi:hypothetical protein
MQRMAAIENESKIPRKLHCLGLAILPYLGTWRRVSLEEQNLKSEKRPNK